MNAWPRVGIVILNWKRPGDTRVCLESLERVDYPSYEVVVVDNSSDASFVAAVRAWFPQVTVLEPRTNLGFAAGNNLAIGHLLDRGVDYILLLNDDTEVSPDVIRYLVRAGEEHTDVGVIGPKIYYHNRPDVIWSAGGTIDGLGRAAHLGVDQLDDKADQAIRDVDYATGCALLVKKQVIEKVGALDERFFAYFEEAEWCARAKRGGFRVVCVPQAHVWHKIEAEARAHSALVCYLMSRNRLLYLKCAGASARVIGRVVLDLLRTALSWRLNPRHAHMRPYSPAVAHGVAHFVLGSFGPPPDSVVGTR